jgi:hypothetical protein
MISTTNTSSNFPSNNQDGVNVYNRVERTPSGHISEIDDTAGNERIRHAHAKGTEEEWDANGGRTLVVRGRNFELVVGDNSIVVTGQCNITVDGNCGILCKGDLTAKAKRIDLTADEDISLHAGTSINMTSVTGDYAVQSGGGYRLSVEGEANERFQSKLDTNIVGDNDLTIGGNFETQVGSIATQYAELGTNIVTGSAASINLASGSAGVGVASSGAVGIASTTSAINFNSAESTIFNSADFTIATGPVSITDPVTTNSTITGGTGVELTAHIHTGDDGGDTGAPKIAPASPA